MSTGGPSTPGGDGWIAAKRFVTSKWEESWVFRDGHFEKQEKGGERRAICRHFGQNGCSAKPYDMTRHHSTSTLQTHVLKYHADTIRDPDTRKKLEQQRIPASNQLTLKDMASGKRKRDPVQRLIEHLCSIGLLRPTNLSPNQQTGGS
ncbi:hypothetical protein M427DRAFT_34571 [Gonapodya prolifera JEL478]|uniref:Uncharacterized protein n=1 Tax=Gonapodya prolifera (strain JEL478) TaxID=1344416 RepID=A0A139A7H6_GONPJ|nr:hypothetical protein M427DRAFT_34571 [Gonapodya prolifera JEL478]|eukprot:KXS12761.1 hypothetical protein M427DRAFT_34571 [Gonapodya prolifera JEL478]